MPTRRSTTHGGETVPGESQQVPDDKPDPTVRAKENLDEAVASVKEQFRSELKRVEDIHANDTKHNDEWKRNVESQRRELKADNERSIQSALLSAKELGNEQAKASKEANDKTEKNVTGLIRQQKETYDAETSAQRREHDALKERVGKLENIKLGGQQAYAGIYVAVGVAVGLLGLVAAVVVAVLKP